MTDLVAQEMKLNMGVFAEALFPRTGPPAQFRSDSAFHLQSRPGFIRARKAPNSLIWSLSEGEAFRGPACVRQS